MKQIFKITGFIALIAMIGVSVFGLPEAWSAYLGLGAMGIGTALAGLPIWFVMKGDKKEFKALTDAELKELPDEQLGDYLAAKYVDMEDKLSKLLADSGDNSEAIKTVRDEMRENFKEGMEVQRKQGEVLTQLVAQMKVKNKKTGEVKSVLDLLEEKRSSLKEGESILDSIKSKQITLMKDIPEVELKASQTPGDIGDRTDLAGRIPGVEQIARRRQFVKAWFRTIPTDSEYIKKTEQDVVVRDAKNVAQCNVTTHNTKLTWKQTTLQQKKVRDFVNICIDMMEDYDFVEGEIKDLINYGVQIKVDNGLLLDDGIGANLNGIASYASTFVANLAGADYSFLTGTPIQAPNLGDLITVAGAQIEMLGVDAKFMPNVAFVNPKQLKLLRLTKDANDQYLLPNILTANGENVDSIVLVGNSLVPENEAYVMDSTMGQIYQRKQTEVTMAFENNDNFETETVTVKGMERLNLWVSTNNSNAFMHITSISLALTAITKP